MEKVNSKMKPIDQSLIWGTGNWEKNEEYDSLQNVEDYALLTSLVRSQYLGHMERSLKDNLFTFLKYRSNIKLDDETIDKIVKKCEFDIEEKALRGCMIAKLYQRIMAKMIKKITECTSKGEIFSMTEKLINQESLPIESKEGNADVPLKTNKQTQTDFETDEITAAEIHEILENTLEFENSTAKLSPIPLPASNYNGDVSAIININGISDTLYPLTPGSDYDVQNSREISTAPGDCCMDFEQNGFERSSAFVNGYSASHYTNNVDCEFSSENDNSSKNGFKKTPPKEEKLSLDKRLENFCIVPAIDFVMPQPSVPITELLPEGGVELYPPTVGNEFSKNEAKERKSSDLLYLETTAALYSLELQLRRIPRHRYDIIQNSFVELFGRDHENWHFLKLSEDEKQAVCKKRMDKLILGELNKYFFHKRIASRELFKAMAKHLLSIPMDFSTFSAVEDVQEFVANYFANGKCITRMEDFTNISDVMDVDTNGSE